MHPVTAILVSLLASAPASAADETAQSNDEVTTEVTADDLGAFVLLTRKHMDKGWVWLIHRGASGECVTTPADLELCDDKGRSCVRQKQRSGWKFEGGFMPWPPFVGGRRTCRPAILEAFPPPGTAGAKPLDVAARKLVVRSTGTVIAEVTAAALARELMCYPMRVDDGRLDLRDCGDPDLRLQSAQIWFRVGSEHLGQSQCERTADRIISCSIPERWRGKVGALGVGVTFVGASTSPCVGVHSCDVNRGVVRTFNDFPM